MTPSASFLSSLLNIPQDWGRVQAAAQLGAPAEVGSVTPDSMAADMSQLQCWSRTAAADLAIAAALLGQPLDQDSSLGDVKAGLVGMDNLGQPVLTWWALLQILL